MTTPFHGLISLFFSPKHDFVTLIQQTKVLSRKKDRYIRSDKAEKPAKGNISESRDYTLKVANTANKILKHV